MTAPASSPPPGQLPLRALLDVRAVNLQALLLLIVLGVLANVCYCAAYLVDIPLQYSSFRSPWRRWRWGLWLADEIYPYVPAQFCGVV
ncbi:MAG TPA: hypothetical protein VGY90_08245 [Steroidobacteraceae bacterium]|jgi:hypothetical protein|nr:hypothetical protein [Steroidobacteraceae bacterium]